MSNKGKASLLPILKGAIKLVWTFIAFFVVTILVALIHSNVAKLAETNHWDGFLIQVWQPLEPLVGFLAGNIWFWFLAGLSAGLIVGVWLGKMTGNSSIKEKATTASTELSIPKNGLEIDFEGIEGANKVETESDVFVRVRVRNIGSETLKNARVFLTSLEEVYTSGSTAPTSLHDATPLPWAGFDFNPRELPPISNADHYVDLMRVSKHEAGWIICARQVFANQEQLKRYRGTYRFQATLIADEAKAARCEVDVSYYGDWHNLRAVAAPVPISEV